MVLPEEYSASKLERLEMPEQDYRSAEDDWSALGFGIQVVSSEYIVLQSQGGR